MKNIKAVDIVGEELAAVLPDDGIPWYRKPYLLRLNLLICIPLLSSSVSGFDGKLQPRATPLRASSAGGLEWESRR